MEMEKEILKVINENLPMHVGDALQKRLVKLDRLEKEDVENKYREVLERNRFLEKEQIEVTKTKKELEDREKSLVERERAVEFQREVNEIKIAHSKELVGVYRDVNEKILRNRTLRESIHTDSNVPRYSVHEYVDANGRQVKNVIPTGTEMVTEHVVTTKEEQ